MADSNLKGIAEGIIGAAAIAAALLTPMLRSRRVKWGATDAEVNRSLPGDELVAHPRWSYTHAITIRASAASVWPWLVQMGQGRGGFYSYELLENLVGCDIHNADGIISDLQHLEIGDCIRLHPSAPGYQVAIVDPGRAIVLHADTRIGPTPVPSGTMPGDYFASTWVFFLDELENGSTRLISRFRSDYNPRLRSKVFYGPCIVEPISFVMQRKMLLGIKQRAEAATVISTEGG